ncbi:MAG: oligosaccharide flippase family protein [Bacteroidota bacterium]|nr:oligosaccharide flippase family protein [Bacteroidota bacterium]
MKHFKPLSIYAFTIFINAAISFGTFSLLTHYLTEVDYGIINLYTSFSVFLTPFIAIGVPFILSVDYFKMNAEMYRRNFTNSLMIPVAACVLFTLLSLLLYPVMQEFIKVNFFFTITIPFVCLMIVLNEIALNLFRNKERPFLFAAFSISKNIFEIGLTILLVVGLGYKWQGRLGSSLLSLIIASVVIIFIIRQWKLYTATIDKKIIATILVAGLPFIPERLAIFVLGYSDRFFIDHYNGIAEVGYYGVGAQLAVIITLSIVALNNTFYPQLYKALSPKEIEYKQVKKITGAFIGLSLLITVSVLVSIPFIFKYFIGPVFQPGMKYAVYLTVGLFFWAIYNVFIVFLLNLKKNKLIMYISLLGMILSLLANFLNIRNFGALGAAYTSILVYFSMAAITIFFVHKYYGLQNFIK